MKTTHFLLLPLAAALSQAWAAPVAEETAELSPVTVTGTQQQKPTQSNSILKPPSSPYRQGMAQTFYNLSPT